MTTDNAQTADVVTQAACACHGPDRPHPPHLPCDMGCQPDWHRDGCAIYVRRYPPEVGAER
jgi:hypothetical protein